MDTSNLEHGSQAVLDQLHAGIDATDAVVHLTATEPRSVIEEAALAAGQLLSDALRQADIYYAARTRGDANG